MFEGVVCNFETATVFKFVSIWSVILFKDLAINVQTVSKGSLRPL